MAERLGSAGLQAKVLTVSDGVVAGTREDKSGAALVERLDGRGLRGRRPAGGRRRHRRGRRRARRAWPRASPA